MKVAYCKEVIMMVSTGGEQPLPDQEILCEAFNFCDPPLASAPSPFSMVVVVEVHRDVVGILEAQGEDDTAIGFQQRWKVRERRRGATTQGTAHEEILSLIGSHTSIAAIRAAAYELG